MKYYVTWVAESDDRVSDTEAMLTVIDGEIDLMLYQIMEIAFKIEEIEPDASYEIYSIIRAKDAEVVW